MIVKITPEAKDFLIGEKGVSDVTVEIEAYAC